MGETYLAPAQLRLADGAVITAGEAFVRASLCFHVGQVVANHMPDTKRDLQRRKETAFREAAPYLVPPAERIDIDHNGVILPGYLRLPLHREGPFACVILVPGLDSTKEDFITLSDMCARRGLASFAFDGPGQGEVRPRAPLEEGYETSVVTVFKAIAVRPEIDDDRIGMLGRSLGGYYIPRAVALEPRIKALAVFGGASDLGDWDSMPKTILGGFLWATGCKTMESARAKMGSATLKDCIGDVACPTLIVHGKRDGIFHYTQAERIAEALGDKAELFIEENGVHCCRNYCFKYRTMMIDWMARTL
jgi:2,6-dihydroxypseudooxynicotine hydrolase